MKNWEKRLTKLKPKRKNSGAFMVRPPKHVADWLYRKADEYGATSVNKVIVAILEQAAEEQP